MTGAGLPGIHADGFVMREHQVIDNLDVYYVVESVFTGLRLNDGDLEETDCAWIERPLLCGASDPPPSLCS